MPAFGKFFDAVPGSFYILAVVLAVAIPLGACTADNGTSGDSDKPEKSSAITVPAESMTDVELHRPNVDLPGDTDIPDVYTWCEGTTLYGVTPWDYRAGDAVTIVLNGCENGRAKR